MKTNIKLEMVGRKAEEPYMSSVTPNELIECAKYYVVGTLELTEDLPLECEDKLSQAYDLLNSVQKCLFNH